MNLSQTRSWSTPAMIALGLFVASTGLIMFVGIGAPIQEAHEWIGVTFAGAMILHILNHAVSFKKYFSQKLAIKIFAAIALFAGSLVIGGFFEQDANPLRGLINKIESAPLSEIAPLLDKDTQNLRIELNRAGFKVENPQATLKEIALANKTSPKTLIKELF